MRILVLVLSLVATSFAFAADKKERVPNSALSQECMNTVKAAYQNYAADKMRSVDPKASVFYSRNYQDGFFAVGYQGKGACLQIIVDTGYSAEPKCEIKSVFSTNCG